VGKCSVVLLCGVSPPIRTAEKVVIVLCETAVNQVNQSTPASPSLEELKQHKQWVIWINDPTSKFYKMPVQPNGNPAKADDPNTWSTYEAVSKAAAKNPFFGIGFELANGYCGQDFDHVIQNGVIEPWAIQEIDKLHTYTEISPSGTGIHCLGKAKLPGKGAKPDHNRVETYDSGRYFTFTGNHLPGTPETINPNQAAAESFYTRINDLDLNRPRPVKKDKTGLTISASNFSIFCDALKGQTVESLLNDDTFKLEVGEGGRHSFLNSVVGYLWDGKRTKEELYALTRKIEERFCSGSREITDKEIEGLVSYCMERGPNQAPPNPLSKYKNDLLAADWFVSADTFLAKKIPPKKVLVTDKAGEPLLTSHTLNEVFAFRGYGKSLFVLGLADIMIHGGEMLAYKSEGGLKVLLCDGELPPQDLQKRLTEFVGETHGGLILMSTDDLPHPTFPALSDPDYQVAFLRQVEELKPDVIIFDTLSACFKFDTNDTDRWQIVNQFWLELRLRGFCVITTHHAGKNGSQRGRTDGDDNLDLIIKLDTPPGHCAGQGLNFILSYEKVRANSKLNGFQAAYDGEWEIVSDGVFESTIEMLKLNKTYKQIEDTLVISSKKIAQYKKKAIAMGLLPPDNLKMTNSPETKGAK